MSNRSARRASSLAIGRRRSASVAVRAVVLAGLVALLASCMRPSALWIVPGATLQALTFGLAQERGGTEPVESLQRVEVRTCYEADKKQLVLWQTGGLDLTHGAAPTRIAYGEAL